MNKVITALGVLVLIIALMFGLTYFGLEWERFWGPKFEDVKRENFEETKSYNEGKIQQLSKYAYEYKTAKTDQDREAIAFTIRHQFADFDTDRLNPELRQFLLQIRSK